MRIAFAFFLMISCAWAQSIPRNRFAFNGGWSREVGGSSFSEKDTAGGFGLSYGYRLHPHVEAEAGVFTALQPAGVIRGAHYYLDPDDRFIWVPFGIRFVAPLYLERIEFSAGGGGLYEKYSVGNPNIALGPQPRDGWGGYFVGSASVALDRGNRFWLGATPRFFLANADGRHDRWFQISGEFSVRF